MQIPPMQSLRCRVVKSECEASAWRPLSALVDSIVGDVKEARPAATVMPPPKSDLHRAA